MNHTEQRLLWLDEFDGMDFLSKVKGAGSNIP